VSIKAWLEGIHDRNVRRYNITNTGHGAVTTKSPDGVAVKAAPAPHPCTPESNPESTNRHDPYVNDIFNGIFAHEDRDGALAKMFTTRLAVNDQGSVTQTSDLENWYRSMQARNQQRRNES